MQNNAWPYNRHVNPEIYSTQTIWPKLTIVIPSYNQGQYIEETILSVLNQNYPNLEFIIIDGGSTDNTVDIIKKYEDRITYWVSEKDNGQSHAINKGFDKSTGKILGWINSDDIYLQNFFFEVASVFIKKNNIDIVYANSITLDEIDNNKLYYEYANKLFDSFLTFGGNIFSHTTFWKKEIHERIDENIICAMDYELWIRLFSKKNYYHLNVFGGVFRLQKESKSALANEKLQMTWKKDFDYINAKHNIKMNKIDYRLHKLISRIHKAICNLKYNKKKLGNSYVD